MSFFAKKSLGQNFLKSAEAVRDIISAGALTPEDTVVEIGPGKGVLTKKLVEHAGKVIAIEKDARLIPVLQETFKEEIDSGKLEIREEDVLESDTTTFPQQYKVIANIPYYITGALVRKFLTTHNQPSRMVLLLQKEVAQRIVARDGKESILSMSVQAYGTPKYVGTVKAKYFSPEPKVDSGILLIENISKNAFKDIPEDNFFKVVKTAFAHKRKMAIGNLKDIYTSELLERAFEKTGVQKTARAEDITLGQWFSLVKCLNN